MKRDIKKTHTQTLGLLDQIGPVVRFDEEEKDLPKNCRCFSRAKSTLSWSFKTLKVKLTVKCNLGTRAFRKCLNICEVSYFFRRPWHTLEALAHWYSGAGKEGLSQDVTHWPRAWTLFPGDSAV